MGSRPSVIPSSTARSVVRIAMISLLALLILSSSLFAALPKITSFTPTSGRPGTVVTITGSGFIAGATVKFNGVAATGVTVKSATAITAVVPKTSTGKMSVTTSGGTGYSLTSFTYIPPIPKITAFTPISGRPGTIVTITGTDFIGATAVRFNGVAATSFTVKSATAISAVVPKTTTGKITVTTPGGTATSLASFTYIPPIPKITSFTPISGKAGAAVIITGTDFTGATSVKFNGVAAVFTVKSATSISAVVPKTTTGKITVTTAGGTATSLASFTFIPPAPVISSFTPASGGAGTTVTITGANFTGATSVKFNGVAAVFTVKSVTSITAVVPKTSTGKITVTTAGGTATSVASFTFVAAPTITTFTPTSGGAGTSVTITGTNFTGATSVKFNGVASTSFLVKSATSITALVPKTTSGKITVTTPGGTATSVASFTFVPAPTITAFTPKSVGAGTSVTITGTNFTGATSVKFTGVAATSFRVVTASSITAVVPKTTGGNITVTTPGGTAMALTTFTFVPAPTITGLTPVSGGPGTSVTITGTNFTGATAVKFNGVPATSFLVKTATSIAAVVPNTTSGKVTVTTLGGTATSVGSFTVVTPPTIASFTPATGAAGISVAITGTNFTGATSVKFNGVAATSFVVNSAISISAVVPKTTTGKITVTTPSGTATSAASFTFIAAPTITSFTPTSVAAGTTVTITGTNLTGATAVKFNNVAATSFVVRTATSITAVVPSTTSGKVIVTTPGGTALSVVSFTFVNVAELIAQGKLKLNELVALEPYDPEQATYLLDQAYRLFSQARTLSPANADANLGLAFSDTAKTAQEIINEYMSTQGDVPPAPNFRTTLQAVQLLNVADTVKGNDNLLSGLVSNYTKSVQMTQATSSTDSNMIIQVQGTIRNKLMPMLARVAGYLGAVETNAAASYTFPIGSPSWEGYVLVDKGDVYLFHGALLAARWALAIPASYNFNPGAFNWDADADTLDVDYDGFLAPAEYLPADPFGTLLTTGAATMTASKTDMITACSKIIAGIDATLAETSDSHEIIPWHTPSSGIEASDLQSVKAYVSTLQSAMTAAAPIELGSDEGSTTVNAYLGAWGDNPPTNLKALMPTQQICYYWDDYQGYYEYDTVSLEGGFADETFGGIFPDKLPKSVLYDTNRRVKWTTYSGNLDGMYTDLESGSDISIFDSNFWLAFDSAPPARFSVVLQRVTDSRIATEPINVEWWDEGCECYIWSDYCLWPNTEYRLLVTDEINHHTDTFTYYTGDLE